MQVLMMMCPLGCKKQMPANLDQKYITPTCTKKQTISLLHKAQQNWKKSYANVGLCAALAVVVFSEARCQDRVFAAPTKFKKLNF
jgi:hypothetical protein